MDPFWNYVLSQLFNGLVWGVILSLLAIGLTIIFGMLNIINFAHGALYTIGTYAVYSVFMAFSYFVGRITGDFWIALLVGTLAVGAIGLLVEFWLLRPMYKRDIIYQLLLTFGLALIIQELMIIIWGSRPMSFPTPDSFKGVVDLGFIIYPKYRLFLLFVIPLIMLGIWLFLERTKFGSIIRAGTEDFEMVNLLGINVQRVFTFIFGFGASMAGLAGGLAGPVLGSAQPDIGNHILLESFVVVVLGGMGSFAGAIAGAMVVGITKSIMVMIWAPASNVVVFVLMAGILIWRPQGLLGKR